MLSTPQCNGWTYFQLEGTSSYMLSYLDNIPNDWLNQAIHGLETMLPFCVKGFLEPKRFLCTVSYWNCHIVLEDDERYPLEKDEVINEFSHTNMIEFCKYLYNDLSQNIDEWVRFIDCDSDNPGRIRKGLVKKLEKLEKLISEKEKYFTDEGWFF